MRVNVEGCWSGGNKYYFRLTWVKDGKYYRDNLYHKDGEYWDREMAGKAKDIVVESCNVRRENIRFNVK